MLAAANNSRGSLPTDNSEIVGGGTAGLVVAQRLLETSGVSVAIIEAGGFYELDNGNISQIPAFVTDFTGSDPTTYQPLIDWGIVTTPQKQLGGREILYASGKCLGGGSARNYLAYQRGTTGAYRQWADNVGDQSFSFGSLLPYFQKSIQFTPPNKAKRGPASSVSYNASAFSSHGGPLQVSYSNYFAPASPFFRAAFSKLGLTEIAGLNSGSLLGFSEFTVTIDPAAATRSSSQTSFLRASLTNPLLQVYQQTLAKKILFSANKTATGVNVSTAGRSYMLSARKEVILAAGTFRSPQLLMVSGIGPAPILKKFGIPVISSLPGVGQNLQDQPLFGVSYQVNVTTASQLQTNISYYADAVLDYLTNQTGPLGASGLNAAGWEKIPTPQRQDLSNETLSLLSLFPADWPELELLPIPGSVVPHPPTDTSNYLDIQIGVLTATSRGNVTINSTDTTQNPVVSPNWLLTQADQEMAIAGFKRARQIAEAAPRGFIVGEEVAPGPAVQSDADILAYIQKSMATLHHASATCKMGKEGDAGAVVDSKGRVFGVLGLRVVDASAFNLLPPGHSQSTVYMLAEKLAQDIIDGA